MTNMGIVHASLHFEKKPELSWKSV